MISKQNNNINVKLIDFWLSKVMTLDDSSYENYGTLFFNAPEKMQGNSYTFTADICSLGMTIFYLMFRRFPVEEKDKSAFKSKIIHENFLETFIQKKDKKVMITGYS